MAHKRKYQLSGKQSTAKPISYPKGKPSRKHSLRRKRALLKTDYGKWAGGGYGGPN